MKIDPAYEKKYKSIVKAKILSLCKGKKCRVFLFGSRATGNFSKSSDFDIGITGLTKKEFQTITFEFEEFLEESIVPYSVDIIDFDKVSTEFKKVATKKIEIWKEN